MNKIIPLIFLAFISCKKDSQDDFTNIIETPSPRYTLSVTAGVGGSVNTSGGEYEQGTSVTITATPNTGYTFTGWSGNATGTSASLNITIIGNTSVTANFEAISYALTVNAEAGGSVSSTGGSYDYGTQVTLSAIPDEGYVFSSWSNGSTDTNITITISENTTLTANFVENTESTTESTTTETSSSESTTPSYTLSVTAGNGGSVNTSGGEYEQGTSVTITATPNTGYTFTGWSGNATGTDTSLTITINGNTTVTANFEVITYTLTVNAGTGGAVSSSGGTYDYGAQITITATPNTGYSFSSWSDGSTEQNITITITQNTTLTANFSENTQSTGGSSSTTLYSLTVSATTGGNVNTNGGEYEQGTSLTITATPNNGYVFTSWSDGSTEQSRTITLSADTTLTANFEIEATYTLTVNAGAGGSVSSSGGTYNQVTEVTLTATPDTGYSFVSWSDGSTEQSRTITLSENTTLTANFELVYTLTVNAGTGGSVSSNGGTYASGTQVTLSATPDTGYSFVSWSDGSTEQSRTITLSENTSLTANFEAVYTLTVNAGTGGSVSSSGGAYTPGTQVTFSATPDTGYSFVNWSDGSTEQSRTITISDNITLTANFSGETYNLTWGSSASGGSVKTPWLTTESWNGGNSYGCCQTFTYNYGDQVNLSALPDYGHVFSSWSDGSTEQNRIITITQDITLTASWGLDSFTFTLIAGSGGLVNQGARPINNGVASDADLTTGSSASSSVTYPYATNIDFEAQPNTGYFFNGWSPSNYSAPGLTGDSTDSRRRASVYEDVTLTANFAVQMHRLNVYAGTNGSVNSATANGLYAYGTEVTITATPDTGYAFVNWSDGSTEQSRTITMTEPVSVTANFLDNTLYALIVYSEPGGGVQYTYQSGSLPLGGTLITSQTEGQTLTQRIFHKNDAISLLAVPLSGKSFVRWECNSGCSGNELLTAPGLNLTINDSDISVTAKFE